jgi:hypothetical protein
MLLEPQTDLGLDAACIQVVDDDAACCGIVASAHPEVSANHAEAMDGIRKALRRSEDLDPARSFMSGR